MLIASRPILTLASSCRPVSLYAQQLRRDGGYKNAQKAIEGARGAVAKVRRLEGARCHTVLAALAYTESKLLRDRGHYGESEQRLSEAINYYSLWVTDEAGGRGEDAARNVALASYKIATFLGDIAWCKNSRASARTRSPSSTPRAS